MAVSTSFISTHILLLACAGLSTLSFPIFFCPCFYLRLHRRSFSTTGILHRRILNTHQRSLPGAVPLVLSSRCQRNPKSTSLFVQSTIRNCRAFTPTSFNMLSKLTVTFAALAVAQVALAAPPACLLASLNVFSHPADQKTLCCTEASKVKDQLKKLCPSGDESDAVDAFNTACNEAGYGCMLHLI